MRRLHKLLNMTNEERLFQIETFLLLGLVRFSLWLFSYSRLQKILSAISNRPFKSQKTIELNTIIETVNRASYYTPGGAKCLARALTTQVLMKQQGYTPRLLIGVAKGEQEQLEAHAWIEYQGEVVIGYLHNLSRYVPMSSLKTLGI